jgi:hypothetical protein
MLPNYSFFKLLIFISIFSISLFLFVSHADVGEDDDGQRI